MRRASCGGRLKISAVAAAVHTDDPQRLVDRFRGQPHPTASLAAIAKTCGARRSLLPLRRLGKSRLVVSVLSVKTAAVCADNWCVVRTVYADFPDHEPSLML